MLLPKTVMRGFMSLVCIFLSLAGCKETQKSPLDTTPVTFSKEGELQIFNTDTDSVRVTLDIELAQTEYEIQTGLMYRDSMGEKQGMLFIFQEEAPHSFYMKNTLIPLDILFIDKDFTIVNIQRNATPLNEDGLPSAGPVQYVLEINAGLSDRWNVVPGDRIRYETTR